MGIYAFFFVEILFVQKSFLAFYHTLHQIFLLALLLMFLLEYKMVGLPGFEPGFSGPKPLVIIAA
jgi:hypothetical protein